MDEQAQKIHSGTKTPSLGFVGKDEQAQNDRPKHPATVGSVGRISMIGRVGKVGKAGSVNWEALLSCSTGGAAASQPTLIG